MISCVAIVSDMIFASRISGTAQKLGAECRIINNPTDLSDALESGKPGIVLVDMDCHGLSPVEAIRSVKSQCPSARVVAFFSHVQAELKEQAASAGADDVWPRSVFVQNLPQLLEGVQADTLDTDAL